MNIGISGQRVERISFDYGLSFLTDVGTEVRIETKVSMQLADGARREFDLPNSPREASDVLVVLHQEVIAASVEEGAATLSLEFTGAAMIEVRSDDMYEAWTTSKSGGVKFAALPGGGISTRGVPTTELPSNHFRRRWLSSSFRRCEVM
ncbi:MAG TPA: DUF6188 family protein [Jatrophihabitantaceae bacterium]|jgi:hypothetical protein|nr:DUF6188 family protein [Jatrophihabitantaceae bacterium]